MRRSLSKEWGTVIVLLSRPWRITEGRGIKNKAILARKVYERIVEENSIECESFNYFYYVAPYGEVWSHQDFHVFKDNASEAELQELYDSVILVEARK